MRVHKKPFLIDYAGKKRGVTKAFLQRIDVDQLWFWTEAWQEKERRAEQAIKKGQVKRFEHVEDLLRELKQ